MVDEEEDLLLRLADHRRVGADEWDLGADEHARGLAGHADDESARVCAARGSFSTRNRTVCLEVCSYLLRQY